jgi:hypothetical protein
MSHSEDPAVVTWHDIANPVDREVKLRQEICALKADLEIAQTSVKVLGAALHEAASWPERIAEAIEARLVAPNTAFPFVRGENSGLHVAAHIARSFARPTDAA